MKIKENIKENMKFSLNIFSSLPSLLSFAFAVALVVRRSIYTSAACNFNQVAFRTTFCMVNVECDCDKGILACWWRM